MISLVRTEFAKALRRGRTLAIGLALVGLPSLIVFAIHARGNGRGGDNGEGLFRLAHQSGLLVPAAVLEAMSAFLLIVIAGSIAGDIIAGDAASGNLRYLLMRPVRRGRLLVAKAFVAGTLIWGCTILVTVTALVGGVLFFGAHPITVPGLAIGSLFGGFHLTVTTLLERLAIATAYVAFGYSALLALGTFFSTVTDVPAGAIGATIGVYVVSEILDGITQLGVIRYGFPTHYLAAWEPMFTQNRFPHDMLAGVAVQLAYVAVFLSAALVWFNRKDIRS
ncbi:MAG: transporter permease [Actinomycetia bacterium]|nr:transporter permease [Actinomycetes bacterium]